MVHLYGVIHGGEWRDILTGVSGPMLVAPSREFIQDLSRFPKGTKIGIESTTANDCLEIRENLATLPFNPAESRFSDDSPAVRPFFKSGDEVYWNHLQKAVQSLGLKIVFLEDKEVWFKYNQATIRYAEGEARRRNLNVLEEGEDERHYAKKSMELSEEELREEVARRRIHEIERDDLLLSTIKSLGVDVAIVGIGHADYWMANRQAISKKLGISFDDYSTDLSIQEPGIHKIQQAFTKNPQINFRNAYNRISLERIIRLLEGGRLTDKKPDLVGTWDVSNPIKGYFEVFMTREGNAISGEIVDCLGDAEFKGFIDDGRVEFAKNYLSHRCSEGASNGEINYEGLVRDGKIFGYFIFSNGYGRAFYATPKPTHSFTNLGLYWRFFTEKYRADIKRLQEEVSRKHIKQSSNSATSVDCPP